MPGANGNDPTPFRVRPEIEGHDVYRFVDLPDDWEYREPTLEEWLLVHDGVTGGTLSSEIVEARPPVSPRRTFRSVLDRKIRITADVYDLLYRLGVDPDEDMEGKVLVRLDREIVESAREFPSHRDGAMFAEACHAALKRIEGRG